MTTDEKYRLIAARVTLDGRPAIISGALEPFALIRTLDLPRGMVEFAWPTVARVVEQCNGAFRS